MPYSEPEFLPWDGRRVPLTLLGGYLGAGKTTLVNALLARTDRPIAVLVNDVGEVNIDAALIKKKSPNTIELTDGCVCCSLVDGFGAAFDTLRALAEPPDHVIVELSGVAQPDRVRPWGKSAGFVLDGVVVMVDAEQFVERLDDPILTATLEIQVSAADLIVLSKLDLASPEAATATRAHLRRIAGETPVIDVATAADAAMVLALGGRRPGGLTDLPPPELFDVHRTELVALPRPVSRPELQRILDRLPADTVRAKAIAEGDDGQRWLVQVVGRRTEISPLPPAERAEPTDLVVIGVGGSTRTGG